MKKSFKLFLDSLDVLDELNDEQSGQLFKAIRAYELDGSEILSGLMKAIFTPFKNNIDRAKSEYIEVCERNKANGLKGGRPNPNKPTGLKSNPNNPDKDKDKDKDKEYSSEFLELWKYYQTEIKGDKRKAFNSYIGNKLNKFDIGTVKKVLDFEMNKRYGQRHLVTIFNSFKDSLEVIEETESNAYEVTGYE